MKGNQQKCSSLRNQADNYQGQIDLLEREIWGRKSSIRSLRQEIINAKSEYKNVTSEFGPTQVPIFSPSKAGNVVAALAFGLNQYDKPTHSNVEDAMTNYNNIRLSNEREISSLEREIKLIGRDISRI